MIIPVNYSLAAVGCLGLAILVRFLRIRASARFSGQLLCGDNRRLAIVQDLGVSYNIINRIPVYLISVEKCSYRRKNPNWEQKLSSAA